MFECLGCGKVQLGRRCALCDSLDEWNGAPLVLVLDHIDGDSANNQRSNLRFHGPATR